MLVAVHSYDLIPDRVTRARFLPCCQQAELTWQHHSLFNVLVRGTIQVRKDVVYVPLRHSDHESDEWLGESGTYDDCKYGVGVALNEMQPS